MLETKAGTATNSCHGCKSEQPTGYCATCGIKACAQSKGYEFCYPCGDSSACELGNYCNCDSSMEHFGHGARPIDWGTSFRFAIIFGIILTWVKSRETKEKYSFQKSSVTVVQSDAI